MFSAPGFIFGELMDEVAGRTYYGGNLHEVLIEINAFEYIKILEFLFRGQLLLSFYR